MTPKGTDGRKNGWMEKDGNGNLALLLMASFAAGGVIDRAGCNNTPLRWMDCKQEQQMIPNHKDTRKGQLNETSEGLFIFQLILPNPYSIVLHVLILKEISMWMSYIMEGGLFLA